MALVASDDHRGLRAAIGRHFQGARWQRCQVRFARNLLARVNRTQRRALADDLRSIFAEGMRTQAMAAAQEAAQHWRPSHPAVATRLEEELEDALTCLEFPAERRVRIRTTNGLERLNQELKRWARVVRIFPHRASLRRLVTALALEQSEEWVSGRRDLDVTGQTTRPDEDRTITPLAAAAD